MTMKTALEIAEIAAENVVARYKTDRIEGESGVDSLVWALGEPVLEYEDGLRELVAEAIKLDRAQRDIYELLAEALDERAGLELDDDNARHPAAEALRATSAEIVVDTIWDEFIGPMLDGMEETYGNV
ncbi:hypothetical protein ACSHWG_00795 [Leucobacter sp. Z1108]|uniref:hypothetical protein n=1 Tax=Leucobacter sp. Z1108 TaxID=3439066 RepID=UPI003F350E82